MADTDPKSPGVPQVQDRRIKIPGLLAKNAQARVLGGIALLMIVIISQNSSWVMSLPLNR